MSKQYSFFYRCEVSKWSQKGSQNLSKIDRKNSGKQYAENNIQKVIFKDNIQNNNIEKEIMGTFLFLSLLFLSLRFRRLSGFGVGNSGFFTSLLTLTVWNP